MMKRPDGSEKGTNNVPVWVVVVLFAVPIALIGIVIFGVWTLI